MNNKNESRYRSDIQLKYGITMRMANTLIRTARGRLKALKELKTYELKQLGLKLKVVGAEVTELIEEVIILKELSRLNRLDDEGLKVYRKKKEGLYWKQKKVRKLKQKLNNLEKAIKENKYSICFGSKKLFKAQYNLEANGYKSHELWLKAFREKRDSQFSMLGSKDEVYSNQEFRMVLNVDGTFALEVRLPDKYHSIYGKHIRLYDAKGNLVGLKHYSLLKNGTSNQKKDALRKALASILSLSKELCKDIVIEDLDFKKKKALIKKGYNAGYNKMLSELEYRRYRETVEHTTFRENVCLIKVNPMYTSYIGKCKYGGKKKLSVHQSAAYVIGRLGQGYVDSFGGKSTLLSKC